MSVTVYDREVSDLDFLIGQTVNELRYSAPGSLRMVFDPGDKPKPALYADLGPLDFIDWKGEPRPNRVSSVCGPTLLRRPGGP